MWEKYYQGIKDPKELARNIKHLEVREQEMVEGLETIQEELGTTYNEDLRGRYLTLQSQLMVLREQLKKAQVRMEELERLR